MAFSMHTNRRAAMSEINVTPLVDVMLVLLIIFMVTAPMMQEGIQIDVPEEKGSDIKKDQQAEDIVIALSAKGELYVNDQPIQEDQLVNKVTEAVKANPKTAVYLRGSKEAPYGSVIRIMGALTKAGIQNVGLITSASKEDNVKK
jgi:biopolymer transport protein TolR